MPVRVDCQEGQEFHLPITCLKSLGGGGGLSRLRVLFNFVGRSNRFEAPQNVIVPLKVGRLDSLT